MSTLEKAISLLQEMPEQTVETVYEFMRSILSPQSFDPKPSAAFGIAHKYADFALMEKEGGAFERAMAEKHAAD